MYIFKLFLILIKYKLYIYDITGSTTVRPPVLLVDREAVTFPVQWSVRFWKHWLFSSIGDGLC